MTWNEISTKVLADYGRCCCLCRRFAYLDDPQASPILTGTDKDIQRRGGIASFHAATGSLSKGEQFELTKSFHIESQ